MSQKHKHPKASSTHPHVKDDEVVEVYNALRVLTCLTVLAVRHYSPCMEAGTKCTRIVRSWYLADYEIGDGPCKDPLHSVAGLECVL